jgi:hypothetical protein
MNNQITSVQKPMNKNNIAQARLITQQIAGTKLKTEKEVVYWMGAVQAQDFPMSKWVVGLRLPGSTEKSVESAIDSGEIIRTHVLRPTWHLVSAEDVYWMLELTAPQIKTAARSRDRELGLTDKTISHCNNLFEKWLRDGNFLPREELLKLLADAGFSNDNNRVSHILMRAEIDGIIGSGSTKAGKLTYALLAERVPVKKLLKRDEAAVELARRYFSSHGPAALPDFAWWSGLPVKECRQAIEAIKNDFVAEAVDGESYFFDPEVNIREAENEKIYLLPAYDEFIISYKNRAAMLTFENHLKAVSNNGVFRPVIVYNGQVIGIWKRTIKAGQAILETDYFGSPAKTIQKQVEKEFEKYVQFLGKK